VAGLVQSTDGYLYGVTVLEGQGGASSVFRMSTGGQTATIYSFTCAKPFDCPNGLQPTGTLIQGTDGDL
jgi:uncharacterized repeat protein (TIGR03803 family)